MAKYCVKCGKELTNDTKFCDACGTPTGNDPQIKVQQQFQNQPQKNQRKQKNKKGGCLAFIIIVLGVIGFITIGSSFQNSAIQKSVSGVKDDSEYITLEEFNKITDNMTYEEVAKIVGSAGTLTSEAGTGEYKMKVITWYGNGVAGSSGVVTFTNNKVSGRGQFGLK